jgi:hypothetical protein
MGEGVRVWVWEWVRCWYWSDPWPQSHPHPRVNKKRTPLYTIRRASRYSTRVDMWFLNIVAPLRIRSMSRASSMERPLRSRSCPSRYVIYALDFISREEENFSIPFAIKLEKTHIWEHVMRMCCNYFPLIINLEKTHRRNINS